MRQTQQLTPGAALLIGLLFIASGIFPMLAAFDIGPLGREDINGPPWLGFVAGGSFVAAGMAVILLAGSALAAVKARLLSGAWPRNEEFIARRKAGGLLRGLGQKPPDQSK